jgi:HEAT repeat protein
VGQATPAVLQTLQAQLACESWRVRGAAATGLARLAGESSAVRDALVRLLDDDFAHVRAHAALAIGSMTANRRAVVPQLVGALADEDPYVRTAAAIALEKIGPDAKRALPALRAALDDETNSLPNLRHPQANPLTRLGQMSVKIRELDQISIAQAARDAIAAIELDHR